jgi:hypothetical protein
MRGGSEREAGAIERDDLLDVLSLLQQIGAMPATPA